MQHSMINLYKDKKNQAIELMAKLDALSPLKTLTRGYSIVEKNGIVVNSVNDLKINDEIDIRFKDGKTKAKIV